ncbi:MAG: alpha/beta family hydrolase [Reyranella sp.]
MLGAAYFLLGDSYPRDSHVAEALKSRLAHRFSSWTDQCDIQPSRDRTFNSFRRRARAFERYMAHQPARQPLVLFGRSSGARLASRSAGRTRAAAVVCLGFPFHSPQGTREPERYLHLATTHVPTLIFQGRSDAYGGADILSTYSFSPSVRVQLLESDHELHLLSSDWDLVAGSILSFLLGCPAPAIASTSAPQRPALWVS